MKTLIELTKANFKSFIKAPSISPHPISLKIKSGEKWAIVGSSKTQILQILNNEFISVPPLSRKYPGLKKLPSETIQFLNFNKKSLPKVHISARYEFFKENLDYTVKEFLISKLVNSVRETYDEEFIEEIIEKFDLVNLKNNWLMGLSNGQLRRTRLAQSLIKNPQILMIDDPFLGLDPTATKKVSKLMNEIIGLKNYPESLILGLRIQDEIPYWITNLCVINNSGEIVEIGENTKDLQLKIKQIEKNEKTLGLKESELISKNIRQLLWNLKKFKKTDIPFIEFKNASIKYKDTYIVKDLNLKINQGDKWYIKGNNGTGKTSLLALIMADHPQSWKGQVFKNGIPYKAGHLSYFEINKSIGMSSPEIHAIFPGELNLKDCLLTGFNIGGSNFMINKSLREDENLNQLVHDFLKNFPHLNENELFKDLNISDQKLILFLRSIIKSPELLILDEALSCMDEEILMICLKIINDNWPGTVLIIGHLLSEVPNYDHCLRLIGPGEYEVDEK